MRARVAVMMLGAVLSAFYALPAWGVPLLFDVNDDDAASPTQVGWTPVNQTGINGVTFTPVGAGVVIDDRDRITDNGGGAEANMWRDFIFASGSDVAGEGMDITITGLLANQLYNVRLWGFDDASDNRRAFWNGNELFIPASPDPATLADQVVAFQAFSNFSGTLVLQGRVGANPGVAHNVFVNGFELTAVPEPASLSAWSILGVAAIFAVWRRGGGRKCSST